MRLEQWCTGVAGRRQLVAQPGGLMLSFVLMYPALVAEFRTDRRRNYQCRRTIRKITDGNHHQSHAFSVGWRRGAVVSGVRRMNEVNARRARLVPGWVTVFWRVYHLGM